MYKRIKEHIQAETCKMIIQDKCTINTPAAQIQLYVTINHVLNMQINKAITQC